MPYSCGGPVEELKKKKKKCLMDKLEVGVHASQYLAVLEPFQTNLRFIELIQ